MIELMRDAFPCPKCGVENEFLSIFEIDVADQPDYRDMIVDRTLLKEACESCGTEYRPQPRFAFFSRDHDLWVNASAWDERDNWRAGEEQARSTFDTYYNISTSMANRMRQGPLNQRLTFGWEALREKIIAAARGLNDVKLELFKLSLQQQSPERDDDGSDLRLLEADEAELLLGRIAPPNEEIVDRMTIARRDYDAFEPDVSLRKKLTEGTYVDLRRLSS